MILALVLSLMITKFITITSLVNKLAIVVLLLLTLFVYLTEVTQAVSAGHLIIRIDIIRAKIIQKQLGINNTK